ncbi:MAG TPA: hypothetical protein VK645_12490 [Chitinophagaceae bacterium]|nr:hypothetical protein [Chitinophagaceae bacterium]
MQPNHFFKASILMLAIVIGFVACWEYYWRSRGFTVSHNDDKFIWAAKRKEVYNPQATIFIGSSRSRFDVDIATWKELAGEDAIQLAFGGTSPRPVLHNLAKDEQFKGKVIIDVAEQIFFSIDSMNAEKSAREAITYFQQETPAQKVSAIINDALERNFVFLEEGKFGLNALLNDITLANRPGIFVRPLFPKEFSQLSFDRQSSFTPMFLSDARLREEQLAARTKIIATGKVMPIKGAALAAILREIKTSIDKIKSRGGMVAFIRPPSNGISLDRENRLYPRKEYWDCLLEYTHTAGYYFTDYPEIANLICVDESHLSPHDAVIYTSYLINILRTHEGWFILK